MILVPKNTKYAVVDMETTGTDVSSGDQIIQFSCTFVQGGQVIDSYSTYVNNGEAIPKDITHLTGINSQTIKGAPSFDQVAAHIYKILSGTVFVAHNVNFDFPFLNAELERVGYPELNIKAIDTVTLSQIFFPELNGYRLKDLSHHFGISHTHPHSSKSDADATAHLLLTIMNKIEKLPLITVQSILKVNPDLPRDTVEFIADREQMKREHLSNLASQYVVVNGIALKNQTASYSISEHNLTKYPKTKKQKEKQFSGKLDWRSSQSKMMNLIYNNYHENEKPTYNLLIEAPTGSGKTLGYLIPMSYLINDGEQLVVSTSTNGLQEQLYATIKDQLEPLLNTSFDVALLKGVNHYINLERFSKTLQFHDKSKQSQFMKARILVWLTETSTGDLDELNLPNEVPFIDQINYQSSHVENGKNNSFRDADFLAAQFKRVEHADIVLVNHNYLFENGQQLSDHMNSKPYLVVDEAHKLADIAFSSQEKLVKFNVLKKNIGRVKNDLFQTHGLNLNEIFSDDIDELNRLNRLDSQLDAVFDTNQLVLQDFRTEFMKPVETRRAEMAISAQNLLKFIQSHHGQIKHLTSINLKLKKFINAFKTLIQKEKNRWTISDKALIEKFERHLLTIINYIDGIDVDKIKQKVSAKSHFYWIHYTEDLDPNHVILLTGDFDSKSKLKENVYQYFQPIIFTGSTLFTSKKSQYIFDQLDLNRSDTRMKRLKSSFDYAKQAEMMISQTTPMPPNGENDEYIAYLANSIWKLISANSVPTLVLFNSLDILKKVYDRLSQSNNGKFMIQAAGVSGSQEKIVKRFESVKDSVPVILGANGYFEGVNFPDNLLKQLIITRIPFDSPNNPVVSSRAKFLKGQNKNPFYNFDLPEAIIKTKQGVGRLIRSATDYGVINFLDSRLIDKRYGKQIIDALPQGLPIKTGSISEIVKDGQDFFKERN